MVDLRKLHGALGGSSAYLRTAYILLFIFWGWFCAQQWRTTDFGISVKSLYSSVGMVLIMAGPFFAVALYGLPWKRFVAGWVVCFFVSIALSEGTCLIEESLFSKKVAGLPSSAEEVVQPRWWPYEHHYLWYDPANVFRTINFRQKVFFSMQQITTDCGLGDAFPMDRNRNFKRNHLRRPLGRNQGKSPRG